jgi:two-component SAPR family response regulator
MKPVQSARLRQTVHRLREKMGTKAERSQDPEEPQICCFNQIRFQLPGKEPQTPKWRTSKAQELFAYLLHHRDQVIDRSTLIELLWPDFEVSRAAQQLYTTIYHIRQTLKSNGMGTVAINSSEFGGGYRLTAGGARIDIEEWENQAKQLGVPDLHTIEQYVHILHLYTGDYLCDYGYLWAEHERQRLRMVWLNLARKISAFYIEQNEFQKAIQVNLQIQQILPDAEESYFTLMKLYDSLGERGNVEEQYWLLANKMERELASSVGEEIKTWYQQWKNE